MAAIIIAAISGWSDVLKIESSSNKIFKELNALSQKKHRDESGSFIVEGRKSIEEGIFSGRKVKTFVFCEGMFDGNCSDVIKEYIKNNNVPIYELSKNLFEKICDTKTPQGIFAVFNKINANKTDFFAKNKFYVYCEDIGDPGNLGTIIRTAAAAKVDGVILSKNCTDLYSPKVIRSTMGCVFRVPVIKEETEGEAIEHLKCSGISIVASSLLKSVNLFEATFNEGVCLVLGNEAHGVSKRIYDAADMLVNIPMENDVESLNVGVAAGIMMYQIKISLNNQQ